MLTIVLNVFFFQVVMPQRQNSGRKRDQVWNYFETLANGRAKCKDCAFDIVPLVERMKKHRLIHDGNEDQDVSTKQLKMDPHVSKTTPKEKSKFDMKVVKFFYACNIPFNAADSPAFKEMIEMLHPGYRPPTRKEIAGQNAVSDFFDFIGDGRDKVEKVYETCGRSKPIGFMKSQMMFGNIEESICNLPVKFMSLVPSSAGVERAFSTMGFIQNDYRNKLNNEKVVKLAFCMRTLRN